MTKATSNKENTKNAKPNELIRTEILKIAASVDNPKSATEIIEAVKTRDKQKEDFSIGELFWYWLYYKKYAC